MLSEPNSRSLRQSIPTSPATSGEQHKVRGNDGYIASARNCISTCVPFQTVSEIGQLIVLFLMPAFIVQVTKFVQFTYYNTYFNINIDAFCNSCDDMACCSSVFFQTDVKCMCLPVKSYLM
jgi:hypothetical protein